MHPLVRRTLARLRFDLVAILINISLTRSFLEEPAGGGGARVGNALTGSFQSVMGWAPQGQRTATSGGSAAVSVYGVRRCKRD
jgi:hypothetical protein